MVLKTCVFVEVVWSEGGATRRGRGEWSNEKCVVDCTYMMIATCGVLWCCLHVYVLKQLGVREQPREEHLVSDQMRISVLSAHQ
jgi:hypothetical protein